MSDQSRKTNRREVLKGALAAGSFAGISPQSLRADGPAPVVNTTRSPDLIRSEYEKPGTKDWLLTKTGVDPHTKHRCPMTDGEQVGAALDPSSLPTDQRLVVGRPAHYSASDSSALRTD